MKAITRTILILSLVSLFNDIASEMLLPILPIYLQSVKFSVLFIGVLEGLAEATSSISKGYFGKISDKTGRRMPFVTWGYALSALSKPMLVIWFNPAWVFFSRTMERLGKGIRTAARDAILSDESAHGDRGKVFGFHRAMDTVGAAIGPSLALLFLFFHKGDYAPLFYIAFFPGILAVSLTFLVKEKKTEHSEIKKERVGFFSQFQYWKESPATYKALLAGLLVFALFNSADAFLILKMKESGADDITVIAIYIFYNLVYALSAFPIGILSDKVGMKTMFVIGLIIFGGVYVGISFGHTIPVYLILFLLYGLYYACTEGVSKAWISKLCDRKDTATAIGVYSGLQSICTFIASSLAGFIWFRFGSVYVFFISGAVAILVALYLVVNKSLTTAKQVA
jgi:MFS family permease